ncbi:Motile sperm domain-containing protein 2 [Halotydeus destructor]|nr:Motile sperm domain-containing protein 2 [Halotydeus destructor]
MFPSGQQDTDGNQSDRRSALDEIRAEVLSECCQHVDKYDSRDVETMKRDINYLRVFTDILSMTHEENVRNALETLQWRKTVKYHDLKLEDTPSEGHNYFNLLETETVSYIFVELRKYHKVPQFLDLMKNSLILVFRILEEKFIASNKPYIVITDLAGAGIGNTEFPMTLLTMSLMYKYFVGYIEMVHFANAPFILKPLTLLLSKLAPSKLSKKLKFCSSPELVELFGEQSLPKAIGGTSDQYLPVIRVDQDKIVTTDEICRLRNIKQSNVDKFKALWNPLTNI